VRFQELANHKGKTDFLTRIQLLELFTHVYRDLVEAKPEVNYGLQMVEARERLRQFLKETLPSDFLILRFVDLARRINCTPRHLSRIFQEVTGMSFRERQAKIRLATATELLASTEAKVVDVALQSGFQSLSLFGLMFKRRFGISPTKWRNKHRSNRRVLLDRKFERVQAV
jgi:AraC-like DNA-binding protein